MNDFSVKLKKELCGKRVFIELRTGKCAEEDSRVEALLSILYLLQDIWSSTRASKGFEKIANKLREMACKVAELQDIYSALNSPYHGYISEEEQRRLIAREKEILAELDKVSA